MPTALIDDERRDDSPALDAAMPDCEMPPRSEQANVNARHRSSLARWALLAVAAMLVAMAVPALRGRVYTADDLGAFHLPLRAFYQKCLTHGDSFDWSPDLFCGFFLTGEGQLGTYHPWHLLLYRSLPLQLAFDLECLANYPLLLAGVYCFLRRWRLRRDAALLGGLCFTFSGFCVLHFVHVNCISVVAHVPWLLLAIEFTIRGRTARARRLGGAALALVTGSQLLLGYPQVVAMSLMLEAAFTLFVLRTGLRLEARGLRTEPTAVGPSSQTISSSSRLKSQASSLLSVAGWKLLGVALGGAQLLPTIEALGQSSRQTIDATFRGWGSLAPVNLLQFVAPYLFRDRVAGHNTHEFGCYAGSVTLLLAVWCVASRGTPRRFKSLERAAIAVAVVGLLLALGDFAPLHALWTWLPLVNKFRFPCRAIVLVHMALAVLAALGWMTLSKQRIFGSNPNNGIDSPRAKTPRVNRTRGLRLIGLLVVLSIAAAIVGPVVWPGETASAWQVGLGPALVGIAALLIALSAKGKRWAQVALLAFAAVDLGSYGMSYAVYPRTMSLEHFAQSQNVPSGAPTTRLAADLIGPNDPGLRQGNGMLLDGWRRVDGYAGLAPARCLDYHDSAALQVANVGWINAALHLNADKTVWAAAPLPPLPFARLVGNVIPSTSPAADLPLVKLKRAALVEPIAAALIHLDSAARGTASEGSRRPGSIRLETVSSGPQLLVLAESFHPGWSVTVGNQAQPVLRVNGDFMGCVVPAGTSQVDFEFRSASVIQGRRISLSGLCFLMAIVVLGTCWDLKRAK